MLFRHFLITLAVGFPFFRYSPSYSFPSLAGQRDKLQKIIVEAKPAVVVVNAVVGGYEALRMKERLGKRRRHGGSRGLTGRVESATSRSWLRNRRPRPLCFLTSPPPSFFILSVSTTAKVVDNVARLYQHGELAAEDEEGWEPCEVLLIGAFLDFTPLSSLIWYFPIVFLCKSPAFLMQCMQCGRSSMVLLEPLVMHALTLSFPPRFPPGSPHA